MKQAMQWVKTGWPVGVIVLVSVVASGVVLQADGLEGSARPMAFLAVVACVLGLIGWVLFLANPPRDRLLRLWAVGAGLGLAGVLGLVWLVAFVIAYS